MSISRSIFIYVLFACLQCIWLLRCSALKYTYFWFQKVHQQAGYVPPSFKWIVSSNLRDSNRTPNVSASINISIAKPVPPVAYWKICSKAGWMEMSIFVQLLAETCTYSWELVARVPRRILRWIVKTKLVVMYIKYTTQWCYTTREVNTATLYCSIGFTSRASGVSRLGQLVNIAICLTWAKVRNPVSTIVLTSKVLYKFCHE